MFKFLALQIMQRETSKAKLEAADGEALLMDNPPIQ